MESGNDHFEIKKFALAPALGGGKVDPLWVQSPPPQKNCSKIARKKKDCKIYLFSRTLGKRSCSHRAFARTKVRWRPLAPKKATWESVRKFKKARSDSQCVSLGENPSFPVDETSLAQVDAITSFINEKGQWLEKWADECKRMYPDYKHDIPPASELSLAKLGDGGIVSTDTCNAAQRVNGLLVEKIKVEFQQRMKNQTIGDIIVGAVEDTVTRAIEDDENDTLDALAAQHDTPEEDNVSPNGTVLSGYCHHHLRNVHLGAINSHLTCYFSEKMRGQLKEIDPKWRISPNMQGIC